MRKVSKTIITLMLITITLSTIILLNKKEVKSNGMFAIMLEKEKGTGRYENAKDNRWPQGDEYVINMYKTYCEKGSILRWNNETKRINATVKGTDKCYVYFDLSEYGTEEHPYLIQTIEDLVRLSNDVNSGITYEGKYFLLTTDLDFQDEADYENANRTDFKDINGINGDEALIKELTTGSGFKPIGNNLSNPFGGNLDGANHKISNLYIENTINETRVSFFGFYGIKTSDKTLEIKNLKLDGLIHNKSGSTGVAGLIAYLQSNLNINNCHISVNVTSDVEGRSNGGIIAAIYEPRIINIKDSSYSGILTGGTDMGGIVDFTANGATLNIENCYNSGTINMSNGFIAGGLVGNVSLSNINIKNSYNSGNIIKNNNEVANITIHIGGLIGQSRGIYHISNSYNIGQLEFTKNTIAIIGGLVGYQNDNTETSYIENSYNKGILKNAHEIGGLVGQIQNSKLIINKSYNLAEISTNIIYSSNMQTTASGFLYNLTSTVYILNSFNSGNITSSLEAEGLVYFENSSNTYVINSYNVGNMIGGTGSSGMFSSSNNGNNKLYVYNVYTLGNLKSNENNNYGIFFNINGNFGSNPFVETKYLYYKEGLLASNAFSLEGLPLNNDNDKNVDELNKNIENINLEEIDESLKGYTLSKWTLGNDGYPTLVN